MKLLLTSEGFTNNSIKEALYMMLEKPVEETDILFVITSSNGIGGDKRWLISIMKQLEDMNFKKIGILDFAGVPEDVWRPRLENSDVLFFSGGNAYHLLYEARKVNLRPVLEELLKTRIFVGNSAGAMMVTDNILLADPTCKNYSTERSVEFTSEAFGFVDFLLRPHVDAPGHMSTQDVIERMKECSITDTTYLLDNESALKVIDGEVEVISEGEWQKLN